MDRIKDFVSTNLNPFLPLARFIYRAALGQIMHTEVGPSDRQGIDASNFLKNGVTNLKIDPEKVNRLLKAVPVKVVEGYISEVKLSIDTKAAKATVVVDKISLLAYMDDHSQYRSEHEDQAEYLVGSKSIGGRRFRRTGRHGRRVRLVRRLLGVTAVFFRAGAHHRISGDRAQNRALRPQLIEVSAEARQDQCEQAEAEVAQHPALASGQC